MIDRAVLWRALEALRPQTAPSGAKRDAAFEELRAALAAQPSHTEAQRGEPALWRYRDSEQCIKPMDGYTPGEGWTPLYDNPQPERKQVTCCAACGWESSFTSPTYYDQSPPRNQAMTTITMEKHILKRLDALEDFAKEIRAALAAPATTPAQPERTPMTKEQREQVARRAEAAMNGNVNLSWRDALMSETEAFHDIKETP